MRDQNNIYIGQSYRLDAKPMGAAGNGFNAGDYKIDIQTVTRQKAQSKTVAVVYIHPLAPGTSRQDVIDALTDSMNTQVIYRVT